MEGKIKLSVRELIEFVMRGGSIDNRYGGMERANEGARIHRRLQKAGGEAYQAEYFLSHSCEYRGICFCVEGRADGVILESAGLTVDEIKTTGVPLKEVNEDFNRLHWAQGICYAYFYALQNQLEEASVQLTYYHLGGDEDPENGEIKRFIRHFRIEEMKELFEDLLERYYKWARWQTDWSQICVASAKELKFPFDSYRPGQRNLAAAVYRTIAAGGKAFCQAPTGIGKTMSTLFPSVKAVGEGIVEKIFYLTAKTITRRAAEDAFSLMKERGLRMKTISLTAKDKICFLEERSCNPIDCPYAEGHYDRVNDAVFALLQAEDTVDRETIEVYARKFRVCPFEFSLDVTLWCDCIICDYNYLFDPTIRLKRFFATGQGPYVFLVDEAHNLVDRAREMYSAQLQKTAFLEVKKKVGKGDRDFGKALTSINRRMLEFRELCQERWTESGAMSLEEAESPDGWERELLRFSASCEKWLFHHAGEEFHSEVLQLYFDVQLYLRIAELYDEHYVTAIYSEKNEVTIRQCCLDPSFLLHEAMESGKAAILFSATLTPLGYFRDVLGGEEDAKCLALPSPFPRENFALLINGGISTRYQHREESIVPIARRIACTVGAKKGNYLVYFPSYQYMQSVYEEFVSLCPETETLLQQPGMEEGEREAFLERFSVDNPDSLVGFCVLGGIYSEGIDLKGERLIGVIVVGVGLPQIGPEPDRIRNYYNRLGLEGFAYAYQYPGMNKVLQAAGRVIRSEKDKGVVVLIDDRFRTPSYQRLFPAHWSHKKYVVSESSLQNELESFWNRQDEG